MPRVIYDRRYDRFQRRHRDQRALAFWLRFFGWLAFSGILWVVGGLI